MTDYYAKQKKHNMIVGAFVIVAFCAMLWMVFIFGELPIAVSRLKSFTLLVNFPDVSGVQENTPVQYCGYQIGRVINVSSPFRFTDPNTRKSFHQVKVSLAIENKYRDIPYNVDVKLMKRGLGSSYILFIAPDKASDKFLADEDILQGSSGVSSEFFPPEVQKKLEELVDSVDLLAKNANDVLGDTKNKENISQILANFAEATVQATETLKSLQRLSDRGSDKVETTANELNRLLGQINLLVTKINDGQGTAGKLLNDGRLYENLLDSSQELQMALEQLKKLTSETRDKGIKIKW